MKALATVVAAAVIFSAPIGMRAQERVFDMGPGITPPRPVKEVKPQYSPGAMREGVQGSVFLKTVVRTDGKTSTIEVVKGLHPDLDKQAVAALEQWEFQPGSRDGKPVAVRINIEMTFTLK